MTRRLTLLTLAALILALVVDLPAQIRLPAGLTRQTWTIGGVERSALIAAPRGQTPTKGAPLVLVFHGHGGTSAQAARSFRIHDAWPEALVIYPQGLPTVGQVTDPEGRRPGWQHTPGGEADRDLKFVDHMLAWAKSQYQPDPARVFAAGHSNGGSMVYVLWAARGDQFAAFAPSSSVFRADVIANATPKPAFIVTGRQDALVPFAAQQRSLSRVLALNHAAQADQPWEGGARRHVSTTDTDVVTYIHPGGHAMPDDAGTLMVRFFKSIVHR
jgi:polyhydroxybutyrate depolymerase